MQILWNAKGKEEYGVLSLHAYVKLHDILYAYSYDDEYAYAYSYPRVHTTMNMRMHIHDTLVVLIIQIGYKEISLLRSGFYR